MSPEWSAATAGDAVAVGALVVAGLLLVGPVLRLALAALSVLPGRIGRAAVVSARAVRPGIARRLVAAVVGLGVPAASVVAAAPAAQARPADLVRPVRPVPPAVLVGPVRPLPPAVLVGPVRPRLPAGGGAAITVVVAPGDTLWDIARRHLPTGASAAEVARAWPRWYAANRAAIGPDPSMLMPGTRLHSPDHRSAGTPRGNHHRPATTPSGDAAARALAQSLDPDRR